MAGLVPAFPVVLQPDPLPVASGTHAAPSYYQNALSDVSKTSRPVAGAAMAVRCAEVMRGMSRPLFVLVRSSKALACGAGLLMPTPPCADAPMESRNTKARVRSSMARASSAFTRKKEKARGLVRFIRCLFRQVERAQGPHVHER